MNERAGQFADDKKLQDLLARLDCAAMREALVGQDPEFALEILERYYATNALGRSDMRAFFDSEGPRMMHESKLKHEDRVPTSADLERWAKA